jgi:hypothetical protein
MLRRFYPSHMFVLVPRPSTRESNSRL